MANYNELCDILTKVFGKNIRNHTGEEATVWVVEKKSENLIRHTEIILYKKYPMNVDIYYNEGYPPERIRRYNLDASLLNIKDFERWKETNFEEFYKW